MTNIKKDLHALFDELRGTMEVSHITELLVFTAFLTKLEPSALKKLEDEKEEHAYQQLKEAAVAVKQKFPLLKSELFEAPQEHRIYKKGLYLVVRFVLALSASNAYSDFVVGLKELKRFKSRISDIADSANHSTTELFKALVGNCENKTLFDGACGLAQIASELSPKAGYLNEFNAHTAIMAERMLILNNREQFVVQSKDSLTDTHHGEQESVDVVVMEPPFALKFSADQRRSLAEVDYLLVDPGSSVPASAGDVLWVQLALSRLNHEGKAYLLLPQGWLFRGGYDGKVREKLLELDVVEAVIALPSQLLEFTSIPPAIVVLNKNKDKPGVVHFVDASDFGDSTKALREVGAEDAKIISELVAGVHPQDKRYRAVSREEIASNENILNVKRYISTEVEATKVDLSEELLKLDEMKHQYAQSQKVLEGLLKSFGF
ncbi:N-6 DNA methylase [Vibrio aestuarianus]|uniref:N-6 DNA methylase n=1 Tax=Vibrio aestuarianus TaxID=28171 RepID=UPI00237C7619|nr:N-6 DNA methylase [Vibrio aestuarianus]MDE1266083.1 SAM-dependent methyltransferase [Vibrio aestuarianus]MDE1298275.1 SAM-dependent methyltransferase [Vibrio aestuarianus]